MLVHLVVVGLVVADLVVADLVVACLSFKKYKLFVFYLREYNFSFFYKTQKPTDFVQQYFAQISFRRLLLMHLCVCVWISTSMEYMSILSISCFLSYYFYYTQ